MTPGNDVQIPPSTGSGGGIKLVLSQKFILARIARPLIRETGDSSFSTIRKQIPSFSKISFPPKAKIVYHETDMVRMLEKYHYSIGWISGSSMLNKMGITPVAVEGISPGC